MDLFEHEVRFGDVERGRLLHHARLFHLLVVGVEELGERVGDPLPDAVAAGRVPYAPVDVRASFERYPVYGDSVVVDGTPLSVGTARTTVGYVLRRATDGARFGTARAVHVSLDADWQPVPLDDGVRDRLADAAGTFPGVAHDLDPADADVGEDPFARDATIRSTQVEAVGGGYFEEYFRAFAVLLEEHLEREGASLGERGGPPYPFVPAGAAVEFRRPVVFEDDVAVEGRLAEDAGADSATRGHYRFRGEDGTRLRGLLEYRQIDADGRFVDGGEARHSETL